MNDVADPLPNAHLVRFTQRSEPFPAEAALLEPLDLDASENSFQDLPTLSVPIIGKDSHLGFAFSKCSHRLRAYLSELHPLVSATGVVSSSAATCVRVAKFSLSIKPTLLLLQLSTPVQRVTPSNLFWLPSLAPCCRLSSSTHHASPRSSYPFWGGGFSVCVSHRRCPRGLVH
jgi:hypothetical protein